MKSKILTPKSAIICTILCLYSAAELSAQVGVGTDESPLEGSLLQLKEKKGVSDDALNAYKGLAMPRVYLMQEDQLYPMFLNNPADLTSGPNAMYSGMKSALDKTHTGLVVYNVNTTVPFAKGLYIWDGSVWKPIAGGGSSVTAGNGLTKTGDNIALGGALSGATTVTLGANDLLFGTAGAGKVGIGGSPTDPSAILEVAATNKGVLLPKVTLTGVNDATTIATPAVGLLVYNTGTHTSYTREGYMFWNGTEWRTIDNEPAIAPTISAVHCSAASLSPSEYTSGTPYSGIMKLPYSGGNGAKYSAGPAITVNGLTFKLQDGKLENGNGDLVFSVTGTPTVTSPTPTLVPISRTTIPFFNGTQCTAEVGNQVSSEILTIAVLSPLRQTSDNGRNGWATAITTPDGYFSVRVFVPNGTNIVDADLQIRNNRTGQVTIMWSSAYAWHDGSSGASNNKLVLNQGVWSGNDGDRGTATTTNASAAWGNADVYYDSDPEQRSYMWTTTDPNDKTAYMMTFMMGAASTGVITQSIANSSKAFFKIDQIHAR